MKTKKTILIVDDSVTTVALLTMMLKDAGYIVFSVDCGEKAFAFLKTQIPDLILLDLQMPGINGFEVCKTIKQNDRTKDIPVIFLTASSDVSIRVEGIQLGAVDYVIKPFQKEELLARIKIHLSLDHYNKELKAKNEEIKFLKSELERQTELLEKANAEILKLKKI